MGEGGKTHSTIALIELDQELVLLASCNTNLCRIHEKLSKLSRLQIIDVKYHNKSNILNFISAIIELVRELVISKMHNNF